MRRSSVTACILLAFWPSTTLLAQATSHLKKEETVSTSRKAAAEAAERLAQLDRDKLRQRGIDLIKDACETALTLDDRRNAARILVSAAEFLWKWEPETARNLFRSAFDRALENYRRDTKPQDTIAILTGESSIDLCKEVIRRAAVCDSALSRQFAGSLEEEKRNKEPKNVGQGSRRSLLRSSDASASSSDAARLMLAKDQNAAIREAQRISSGGVPRDILFFLWVLASRDRAAADQLFLWLLANICQDEASDAAELQQLAPYAFNLQFLWVTDGIGGMSATPIQRGLEASSRNPASEARLIEWYIEASFILLSRTVASDLTRFADASARLGAAAYLAIWLEPRVAEARPELNQAWHEIVSRLSSRLLAGQRTSVARLSEKEKKLAEQYQANTPNPKEPLDGIRELLERADKSGQGSERDQLYEQAAVLADHNGDLSWAIQIATRISDEELRQSLQDWIYFNAATRALSRNDLPNARAYALAIRAPDQCADLFCTMARAALKEEDRAGALDFLAVAEAQASKADHSPAKVRALVNVGSTLVTLDPAQALQTMASAVETANRLPEYALERPQKVRSMGNDSGRRYVLKRQMVAAEFDRSMAALARIDFDAALSLAQSLENLSLRLAVVVAVASTVLNSPQDVSPSRAKK